MKMILSFILGMSFTAGVVYAGQARAGGLLVGGVVMGAAVTAVVVWKMRERVFPVRETHHIHPVVERVKMPVPSAVAKSKSLPTTYSATYAETDAAGALIGFGLSKKEAWEKVNAVDGHKGMGFEELMRKCLERKGVGR